MKGGVPDNKLAGREGEIGSEDDEDGSCSQRKKRENGDQIHNRRGKRGTRIK
jgi:hypothetical protein